MYRPTKSGMGNSVVRLVFVSFDYFSNFQFPEKSSGRGDMTLCQQRDRYFIPASMCVPPGAPRGFSLAVSVRREDDHT